MTSTQARVDCAPWCQDGKGHSDCHHVADQYCFSTYEQVPLTTRPLVECDMMKCLDNLDVLLRRQVGGQTVVVLNDETTNREITLALPEAEHLASVIHRLLVAAATEPLR
jgi:hypothetical protein